MPLLSRLSAVPRTSTTVGSSCVLEGDVPAARVHGLELTLPSLTRGEALLECAFDHYRQVRGEMPTRPRWDHNPLDRKEYLLHVQRRV
jgi:ribosomal protection tetracycline resistance protein